MRDAVVRVDLSYIGVALQDNVPRPIKADVLSVIQEAGPKPGMCFQFLQSAVKCADHVKPARPRGALQHLHDLGDLGPASQAVQEAIRDHDIDFPFGQREAPDVALFPLIRANRGPCGAGIRKGVTRYVDGPHTRTPLQKVGRVFALTAANIKHRKAVVVGYGPR
jgi:hypothetical protein